MAEGKHILAVYQQVFPVVARHGHVGHFFFLLAAHCGAVQVESHRGQIRHGVSVGQVLPQFFAPDADGPVQRVDKGIAGLQGVVGRVAFAHILYAVLVFLARALVHTVAGAERTAAVGGALRGILAVQVAEILRRYRRTHKGKVVDLVPQFIVLGQVLDGTLPEGALADAFLPRRPAILPAVVGDNKFRPGGRPILPLHMGAGIDVEVDVGAVALVVGILVLPESVPTGRRGAAQSILDDEVLRVVGMQMPHLIFLGGDGGLVVLPGGGNFRGQFLFRHYHGLSCRITFYKNFFHGIAHDRAVAVVLGQVPEIQGLRFLFGRSEVQHLDGIHPATAVVALDTNSVARADGDGIALLIVPVAAPGDRIVLLRGFFAQEVQTHRQLNPFRLQGIRQLRPFFAVAVHPVFGHGDVHIAQAAVGHGKAGHALKHVAVAAETLFIGIGRLIDVEFRFKMYSGIDIRIGIVGVGRRLLRVIGYRLTIHRRFEHIDVIGLMRSDIENGIPAGTVILQRGRDPMPVNFKRLAGTLVVHRDGHRQAVFRVALVDPLFAHQDQVGVAGAVGDDAGIISLIIPFGLDAQQVAAFFQQHILILLAFRIKFRQAVDDDLPCVFALNGDVFFFFINAVYLKLHRAFAVAVHREGQVAHRLRTAGGAEQREGIAVIIFTRVPAAFKLLFHRIVNGVGDGIGDNVGLLIGRAAVLDLAVVLGQRKDLAAVFLRYGHFIAAHILAVLHAAFLPDGFLHPAVFQFPALPVVLRVGVGVGDGEVLGKETEYLVGVFGVLPFIFAFAAGRAGLQAQFHHHIFKKRLEGSRLPLLGDGHRHGAAQPVGKGAAAVQEGIAAGAFRSCGEDGIGHVAVLAHHTEHLFIAGRIVPFQIFAHHIQVCVALGVVFGQAVDLQGILVGVVSRSLGLDRERQAAVVAHQRGGAVRLVRPVTPEFKNGFRPCGLAVVQPDLGGVPLPEACQGQLDRAAAVHRVGRVAIVGDLAVVVADGKVVPFLGHGDTVHLAVAFFGFRCSVGDFALFDGVADAGIVQVIAPETVHRDGDTVGILPVHIIVVADMAVIQHLRQLEIQVLLVAVLRMQMELVVKCSLEPLAALVVAAVDADIKIHRSLQHEVGAVILPRAGVLVGVFFIDFHHGVARSAVFGHKAPADAALHRLAAGAGAVGVAHLAGQRVVPVHFPYAGAARQRRLRQGFQAQGPHVLHGQGLVLVGPVQRELQFIQARHISGAFALGVAVVGPVHRMVQVAKGFYHFRDVVGEGFRVGDKVPAAHSKARRVLVFVLFGDLDQFAVGVVHCVRRLQIPADGLLLKGTVGPRQHPGGQPGRVRHAAGPGIVRRGVCNGGRSIHAEGRILRVQGLRLAVPHLIVKRENRGVLLPGGGVALAVHIVHGQFVHHGGVFQAAAVGVVLRGEFFHKGQAVAGSGNADQIAVLVFFGGQRDGDVCIGDVQGGIFKCRKSQVRNDFAPAAFRIAFDRKVKHVVFIQRNIARKRAQKARFFLGKLDAHLGLRHFFPVDHAGKGHINIFAFWAVFGVVCIKRCADGNRRIGARVGIFGAHRAVRIPLLRRAQAGAGAVADRADKRTGASGLRFHVAAGIVMFYMMGAQPLVRVRRACCGRGIPLRFRQLYGLRRLLLRLGGLPAFRRRLRGRGRAARPRLRPGARLGLLLRLGIRRAAVRLRPGVRLFRQGRRLRGVFSIDRQRGGRRGDAHGSGQKQCRQAFHFHAGTPSPPF